MSELGIIIEGTDDRLFSSYAITVSSLLFFSISLYKLSRLIKIYDSTSTSMIILIIHLEIITIFICKYYLVRATWCLLLTLQLENWSQVLDSLVCVLLTILGNTFTFLWMDLALSNNSKYSLKAKENYTLIVIICISILTLIDLLLHLYLAIFLDQSLTEKFTFSLITNNAITLIVSILLFINALYACKFIKIVYSKAIGNKIANRILIVTLILISSYELKSLIPIFLPYSIIKENT